MILSVSRRTDIPAFYSEWFMNRIRDKYVMVRNPMNYHQVSRISLTPEVVDCIVFWSKNPAPLIPLLKEIEKDYPFYFQYTLNAYDADIEPNLPSLEDRIRTFRSLAEEYGKEHVIWRYDPIILSEKYDIPWHTAEYSYLADQLTGYTDCCVFSFVDMYDKVRRNMTGLGCRDITARQQAEIASVVHAIAENHHIELRSCAEEIDLDSLGITHSRCIDPDLIKKIIGCPIRAKKDTAQRGYCQCVESIDIGQYNTCRHGCKYCYANFSNKTVIENALAHNPKSPLIVGWPETDDKVSDRKVNSIKDEQISLF